MSPEVRMLVFIHGLLAVGDPLGVRLWKVWCGEKS